MNFTSANWKFILKLYIYLHEVKQRQEIQFNLYKSSSKASDRKVYSYEKENITSRR